MPRLPQPSPERGLHEEALEGGAHAAGVLKAWLQPNLGADLVQPALGSYGGVVAR
jgi:hypothetical protein